ncbi:MAG: hypothetical protein KF894_30040 [Labilithrix sp.]|nr:hypothetical protein [Labilithrix sp.]
MSPKSTLLTFALAGLGVIACRRSAEGERGEVGQAELRAARRPVEIETRVIDEVHDRVAIVRREQLELRARLRAEVTEVDRELAGLHAESARIGERPATNDARLGTLLERRRQLLDGVARIDRSDEQGWDELKAQIEADLAPARRGRI